MNYIEHYTIVNMIITLKTKKLYINYHCYQDSAY